MLAGSSVQGICICVCPSVKSHSQGPWNQGRKGSWRGQVSWLCAGLRLTSGRCAPSTTPLHCHPHIPDSLWHRTLAVTLSVYWLGCPGVADQPLGLREALSCCPHPLPFILPLPLAACGSCGTCTEIRAPGNGGGGVGASNKTKSGEGEGWETYITMNICHWLYTIGCMEMGGEGGRVLTHRAGPPGRNGHFKCLRASSGTLALSPLLGLGAREEGIVGQQLMWESSAPPPEDSFTRTVSPQVLAPGGGSTGTGYPLSARPPLSISGD